MVGGRAGRFDPEAAVRLMAQEGVRNAFLPPTALKLMRQAGVGPVAGLRTVASAGEAMGAGLLDWGREVFGRAINEFYGQTECNAVVANCAAIMEVRPGSAGRAVPGHEVGILGPDGARLEPGETGEIAVRRPDPAMFVGYWNAPEKTAERFAGDWLRTGDEGSMDAEGYLRFASRADDVITSSGYRIGPSEIEECLAGHPDVAMVAVVGVPDPIRTEAVKAFVVLAAGQAGNDALIEALQQHVRGKLAPYEYPKEIEFIEALPMTTTGKVQRRVLRERELERARQRATMR